MPHLERGNCRLLGIFRLKPGDQFARIVAQATRLVEAGMGPFRDKAAIAGQKRQLLCEHQAKRFTQGGRDLAHRLALACDVVGKRQKRGRGVIEQACKRVSGGEPVAHGGEIARAAAAEREARKSARDIGRGFQHGAEGVAKIAGIMQPFDGIEAAVDVLPVRQGCGEAAAEFARACPRHRPVDGGEKRAPCFTLECLHQFEIGAGSGVDCHRVAGSDTARRHQGRHPAHLGQFDIVEKRAQRAQFRPREGAEPIQRGDAKMRCQTPLGLRGIKSLGGKRRHRRAGARREPLKRFVTGKGLGDEEFARRESGQFSAQRGRCEAHDREVAGRDIRPGEPERVIATGSGQRRQIIMRPRVEQRLLGDGAGGDEALDRTGNDRFCAPFLRFRRVFHLLADRHLEALADQAFQIGFVAVNGNAAHRDIVAQMFATLGQRDVERRGGGHGIGKEKLVKIAHPVEQKRVRPGRLDFQILRHHGCRLPRGGCRLPRGGRRRRGKSPALRGGRHFMLERGGFGL